MNGSLLTIGHSKLELDTFLKYLNKYTVNYLIDVRSVPLSKFAPCYNRDIIKVFLNKNNINYVFMGASFGARPSDRSLYNNEGYLDFNRVINSESFISSMESIKKGLASKNNIALMCTEKDPIDCHRAIMITRAFALHNISSFHILNDGSLTTQEDIDERLLDIYFPNRYQVSLFDSENLTREEMLSEAYKLRNKKIGYIINEEKS